MKKKKKGRTGKGDTAAAAAWHNGMPCPSGLLPVSFVHSPNPNPKIVFLKKDPLFASFGPFANRALLSLPTHLRVYCSCCRRWPDPLSESASSPTALAQTPGGAGERGRDTTAALPESGLDRSAAQPIGTEMSTHVVSVLVL